VIGSLDMSQRRGSLSVIDHIRRALTCQDLAFVDKNGPASDTLLKMKLMMLTSGVE